MPLNKRQKSAVMIVLLSDECEEHGHKKTSTMDKTMDKKERDKFSHKVLLNELRENNPDDYKNYLRMNDESFKYLLTLVSPVIQTACRLLAPPPLLNASFIWPQATGAIPTRRRLAPMTPNLPRPLMDL